MRNNGARSSDPPAIQSARLLSKGSAMSKLFRSSHSAFANAAFHLLAFAALIPFTGYAQESKKEWRILNPNGHTGIYDTQQVAVEAIKTLPAPPGYPSESQAGWQLVDKIKSTTITAGGTIAISYWMGGLEPLDPDWSYTSPHSTSQTYSSEEEVLEAFATWLDATNPACPARSSITLQTDWRTASAGYEGRAENRNLTYHYMNGHGTPASPCVSEGLTIPTSFRRTRRLYCPNEYTHWSYTYTACVSEAFVATITSKIDECDKNGGTGCPPPETAGKSSQAGCDGNVGNPCNVKTGEKYETELDFDLGWISLTRHYHSGVSTSSGGFGNGWTHSLGARLVIGGPDTVGIIEGTGYQRSFKKLGSVFESTDGSGDRLVVEDGWLLYTSNSVTSFGSDGLAQQQLYPDGTYLTYGYDSKDRLATVTHSSGRAVSFHYLTNAYDARIESVSQGGVPLVTYTYTAWGQVETATYPGSGARIYHYEDPRFRYHLTGITAEDNRRYSTFGYDEKGRAVTSEHTGGVNRVSLLYRSAGGAVVTDALNHETTYELTPGGSSAPSRKVTGVSDSRGSITRTYYDASMDFRRRLDTVTDRDGTQTKHSYAEDPDPHTGQPSRLHTVKEALGSDDERTTVTRWDIASNRLSARRVGNSEVRYRYNDRLQPVTVIAADLTTGDLRTTAFSYCEAADVSATGSVCPILGLLKSVDGPRSDVADVSTYAYYPNDHSSCATSPAGCAYRRGDLWKTTNAAGHVTEVIAYDAAGRVRSMKDANGVVTDLEYHDRGWPTKRIVRGTTPAQDAVLQIDYWPTGMVQKIIDPDGVYVSFGYDAAQRLRTVTDGAGNTIEYDLDDAGNRLQEDIKDASGALKKTLSRIYNTLGQMTSQSDAREYSTGFEYDIDGNADNVTDALQRVNTRGHDALNRLKWTLQDVDGIEAETGFKYDALDNVTKVTDPKGLETHYKYNGFGDLMELSSPDTGTTSYTYDSAGNRKTQTDARGVVATYTYDVLNRLKTVSYSDGTPGAAYAYDLSFKQVCGYGELYARGRLTKISDASGTTSLCYDRFGELVRKVQTSNGRALTLRYAYTKSGQLQRLTYPDGTVVDYVRNPIGQVTDVGVTKTGQGRELLLEQASYLPFGPSLGWTYGNGRALSRDYDQDYRPQAIHDAAVGGLSAGFGFDEVGNLDALSTATSPVADVNFKYDHLNRLTDFLDGQTSIESYGYDATGNRTSFRNSAGTVDYSYPLDSHRLESVGGIPRDYDEAGNTTSIAGTAREFVYDGTGRMTQVMQGGTVTLNYRYNGKGEQVRKYLGTSNTYSVYDEAGRWLGDYANNGAPIQQAIWLDDLPVGLLAGATKQLHYIEPDHLGTPRVVIDPQRNVAVWAWDLKSEAFGNSPPHQDPDGDGAAFVLDMRFPGQRYDAVSGVNYNYFRDYEPGIGRYVQSDLIGLAGGVSTYAYVNGNPVNLIDPLGLEGIGPWTYAPGQNYGANACQQAAMTQMMGDIAINITPLAIFETIANIGFDTSINPMSWGDSGKRDAAVVGTVASGVFQAQGYWDSTRVSPYHARYQDLLSRPNSGLGARNAASTANKLANSNAAMNSASRMRAIGGPGIGALGAIIGGAQAAGNCTCPN